MSNITTEGVVGGPVQRLRPVRFARESDLEETNATIDGLHAEVHELHDRLLIIEAALAAFLHDLYAEGEDAEADEHTAPDGEPLGDYVPDRELLSEDVSDDGIEETPEQEAARLVREAAAAFEQENEEPAPAEGRLVRPARGVDLEALGDVND